MTVQTDLEQHLTTRPVYSLKEQMRGDIEAWLKVWKPNQLSNQPFKLKDGLRLIWNYAGLRATLLFRLSHWVWQKHIPALPGMLARLNIMLYGFDVPCTVDIGPGLYVPHPVGTVITANLIGKNLSIISVVTIGMRNEPGFPTIGDNVFIGAGARVLGNITIGDNVVIGANAVVVKDVPANSSAVGVPAKVTPRLNS